MCKKNEERGFTLIEVLIALVIFGIVISLIFTSFREIAFSAKTVDQSSKNYEAANACLLIMTSDLESVFVTQAPKYVEPGFNSESDLYRFEGNNVILNSSQFPVVRFTSRAHLPVNRDFQEGIAEIVYYVDEEEGGELVLRRSDRIHFEDDFQRKKTHPVLYRKLKKMSFKYYDTDGGEFEEWDSESEEFAYATPSYISIQIESGDEKESFAFSTRVTLRSVRQPKEEK